MAIQTQTTYLNHETLKTFNSEKFKSNQPFPWSNLQGFLTEEGFRSLYENFPSLDLFEQHSGIVRDNGQRPHNRYYLAYENSIYHEGDDREGVVKFSDLPTVWQAFLTELIEGKPYSNFIKSVYDVSTYRVRFAWHVGFNGCEVSPHVDSPDKIGTHILYFNTSDDWLEDWGGEALVLNGKQTAVLNPDYTDFTQAEVVQITDNHSFLFKNEPEAWHGVKPLTCPDGSYRRLFNIIFEFPPTAKTPKERLSALLPSPIKSLAKSVIRK